MEPLPTRVNRACERCRRNKSRCDVYRPCSLCLRANVRCTTAGPASDRTASPARTAASPRRFPPYEAHLASSGHKRTWQEAQSSPSGIETTPDHASSRRWQATASSPSGTLSPRTSYEHHEPVHDENGDGESAIAIAQKIHRMESQHIDDRAINAIPGADVGVRQRALGSLSQSSRAATASYLTHALPPEDVLISLIEEYFESIHWFSLVILESKFRPAFEAIRGGSATLSDRPFLLLLSTILGLAAWYRGHMSRSRHSKTAEFWRDWSKKLIANSESQIIEVMSHNTVTAIQTLILLGSFYVYHGRPNLSFALLGATVKAAQAAGLHRETTNASLPDREEKKRVWWTIYTWDRFASITYGRPLGVSDKDCNVSQPQDVLENPHFAQALSIDRAEAICYSTYQRELNTLYLIASPAIKNIYSAQASESCAALENLALVRDVTLRLWTWRQHLPEHLLPCLENDCPVDLAAGPKAHCLQSLSLQLTFDSLIIVLHRPFIKQGFDPFKYSHDTNNPEHQRLYPSASSESSIALDASSHQQWWAAAVRTSRVTELPRLAHFATDSHLVAFLAINLFNAAMVMIAVALSDPLSNSAQEAKRAVARIYRSQETLGSRSTLSEQSSRVLYSLVQLLLRRETDAILAPAARGEHNPAEDSSSSQIHEYDNTRMTVPDAPSMPFVSRSEADENQAPVQPKGRSDLLLGFNDGLTSVQKAFTNIPSDDLAINLPSHYGRSTEPWTEIQGVSGFTGSAVDQFDGSYTSAAWNGLNAVDDSGLYWFWSPTWDDLYNGMDVGHL